jgi:hypothetical protein
VIPFQLLLKLSLNYEIILITPRNSTKGCVGLRERDRERQGHETEREREREKELVIKIGSFALSYGRGPAVPFCPYVVLS